MNLRLALLRLVYGITTNLFFLKGKYTNHVGGLRRLLRRNFGRHSKNRVIGPERQTLLGIAILEKNVSALRIFN